MKRCVVRGSGPATGGGPGSPGTASTEASRRGSAGAWVRGSETGGQGVSGPMVTALRGWAPLALRTRRDLSALGVSLVTLRALERRGLVARVWSRAPAVVWRRTAR